MPSNAPNKPEHEKDITCLDILSEVIEEHIFNYEIIDSENLHDEESDAIWRVFWFERGLKKYHIVLDSVGFIRSYQPEAPKELLMDIHNAAIDMHIKYG